MRKLPKKVTELQDWLDMALDEFQRIHSCPGANEEIKQLCERGQRHIRQRVPLIHQCAELSTQLLAAKIALREAEAARGEDSKRLDWLEALIRACPHAEFYFSDDEANEKPIGFSIEVDGCDPSSDRGDSLRACIDAARAQEAKP